MGKREVESGQIKLAVTRDRKVVGTNTCRKMNRHVMTKTEERERVAVIR